MNSYRLHINSDERGPWRCLVRAESVESAIRYGEQVFPGSDITVTRVVSPPKKKPEPVPKPSEISGVWGFSRYELGIVARALSLWGGYHHGQNGRIATDLSEKILRTLEMEIEDTDGPF